VSRDQNSGQNHNIKIKKKKKWNVSNVSEQQVKISIHEKLTAD
jgi:hypothetical protein